MTSSCRGSDDWMIRIIFWTHLELQSTKNTPMARMTVTLKTERLFLQCVEEPTQTVCKLFQTMSSQNLNVAQNTSRRWVIGPRNLEILWKAMMAAFYLASFFNLISDLQIGVRGRLRIRVSSSEHAHFESFRPSNLKRVLSKENSYSQSSSYCNLKVARALRKISPFKPTARAQNGKLVLVLQSEGRY